MYTVRPWQDYSVTKSMAFRCKSWPCIRISNVYVPRSGLKPNATQFLHRWFCPKSWLLCTHLDFSVLVVLRWRLICMVSWCQPLSRLCVHIVSQSILWCLLLAHWWFPFSCFQSGHSTRAVQKTVSVSAIRPCRPWYYLLFPSLHVFVTRRWSHSLALICIRLIQIYRSSLL